MVLRITCCNKILSSLKICYHVMDWCTALIKIQLVCSRLQKQAKQQQTLQNNFSIILYQENILHLFGEIWNGMKEQLLPISGVIGVSEKCLKLTRKVNMGSMPLHIIKY